MKIKLYDDLGTIKDSASLEACIDAAVDWLKSDEAKDLYSRSDRLAMISDIKAIDADELEDAGGIELHGFNFDIVEV